MNTKRDQDSDEEKNNDREVIKQKLEEEMSRSLKTDSPLRHLQHSIGRAKMLQNLFNLHFRDEFGYTLLGRAIKSHQFDVIKYLIEDEKFKVKEELIIAVETDYKKCVDYLIKHDPKLVNRKTLAGTVCRPGTSPVMVASLMENESMLKFLLARGGKPLELPEYDPSELNNIIRFDAIYQVLVALSKPVYLCVMNEDPVMMAFKISETCSKMSSTLDVAKDDLMVIKNNCETFAANFIKQVATFEDLELTLSQMTTEDVTLVAPGDRWERLKYAMTNNHIEFVANASVQKLMKKKFMEGPIGLTDFASAGIVKRSLFISFLVALVPIWLLLYLFFPASQTPTGKFVKSWIEMPFMRFIVQISLYFLLIVMVWISAVHATIFPMDPLTEIGNGRLCVEHVRKGKFDCIDSNTRLSVEQKETFKKDPHLYILYLRGQTFQVYEQVMTNNSEHYITDGYIAIWTLGNIQREFQTIWADGFSAYNSDWVNSLNILLNFCFLTGTSLRYIWIASEGYQPQPLFRDETGHPLQLASSIRAFGFLLLLVKVFKLLRITEVIGQPQYLLKKAFNASFQFFLLFFCLLVACSIGANGLIWRTYRDYIKNCHKSLNGEFTTTIDVRVPCETQFASINLKEMDLFQNYQKVLTLFFFGMFSADAHILENFPVYENAQEWTLAILYSFYSFFTLIIRLNILISLIIFSLVENYQRANEEYKFYRTKVMMAFIDPEDATWIPSPLNLIPTFRNVQHYIIKKAKEKKKYTTSPAFREQMKKEAMEQIRKEKSAIGKMVDNVSRRTLRLTAKEKVEKKITIDHLNDLKAALSPVFIQSKSTMSQLDENMRDFICTRFLVSKRALERKGEKV
ncbi:transient-receptor-potential-like protein isoform X2 [Convolutriloba macropyga]|uniref:transient-receptor-potential-like protein isoform X2 n=1 Tax=Convolutriloba macropyga TaxID=536237 RepID=UPI003F521614